jgi:hypothetical protein
MAELLAEIDQLKQQLKCDLATSKIIFKKKIEQDGHFFIPFGLRLFFLLLKINHKRMDLPSLRASTGELLTSFNAQAKAPDIQLLELCAFSEELSASFNTQNQSPDDSHSQDRQCPCTFVETPRHCRQVFSRSPTKYDILHLSFQLVSQDSVQELSQHICSSYPGVSRTEFQFCSLRIRFVIQGVVCSHSVVLGDSWTFTSFRTQHSFNVTF